MEILFSEERMPSNNIIEKMYEAAETCLKEEGIDHNRVTVSVTFVSSEEIRELNGIYRGVDSVTDVLSFPQYDKIKDANEDGIICLGDVVICTEQALLQADEFGHSPERELVYLFVHSLFHLMGYDHTNDAEKSDMRDREENVMQQVGLGRD
ncbi:MAG: rRNA maturation RNase YbeY [Clostridiales bacterium]|jgi:probable rRNA maturation factor|nr:rRNA maturation RNase YbeY [Clostridiales bacterium]